MGRYEIGGRPRHITSITGTSQADHRMSPHVAACGSLSQYGGNNQSNPQHSGQSWIRERERGVGQRRIAECKGAARRFSRPVAADLRMETPSDASVRGHERVPSPDRVDAHEARRADRPLVWRCREWLLNATKLLRWSRGHHGPSMRTSFLPMAVSKGAKQTKAIGGPGCKRDEP